MVIHCITVSETEVEIRKWGNSLGIVIPAEIAKAEGLKPHDKAWIKIMKIRYSDPRAFGFLKDSKLNAQEIKDRLRKEHEW